ncbi:hypothetical protein HKBW3S03_01292 [Candidatus Hakubella thermalkaliphila]|uniref:Uncharacterized protein n=1 Tax=Candidatus Hakubella thermalkaliphila TaxID=2754717 RepID=A0A6V8NHQ8_9ACTN|nr:hypothetical protein HKBW3S03_01292 [Candidatus Hakubella thermalkaliphila]
MSIDQDFCLAYSRCSKIPTEVGTVTASQVIALKGLLSYTLVN